MLIGCSPSTDTPAVTCTPTTYLGPPLRTVPESIWNADLGLPIDGQLDETLASRLDTRLTELLEFYPAVSAAVAIPGEGMWTAAKGVARADTQTPLPDPALFQVASISKAFTSVIVQQLVLEGKFSLNDSVAQWFPEVPNAELMTVGDLLEHTNGLVSFNALPDGRDLGADYRSPDELVAIVSDYPAQFCPGASWAYTNTGYVILGRIIEATEDKSFAEVLQARITQPLGLDTTTMPAPRTPLNNVVSGHANGIPSDTATDTFIDYATPYTSGALASTAADLLLFWHALLAGQLTSEAAVRQSFGTMYPMQPLIPAPAGTQTYYGQGVQLTNAPGGSQGPGMMLGHSGGITGFNAEVAYLVEDNIYIAVTSSDREVSAAAGLWALTQVVREVRTTP